MQKENFDEPNLEELSKMVGWIDTPDKDGGTWDVTMFDGSVFVCKEQSTAQILASIEEVKALLMREKI